MPAFQPPSRDKSSNALRRYLELERSLVNGKVLPCYRLHRGSGNLRWSFGTRNVRGIDYRQGNGGRIGVVDRRNVAELGIGMVREGILSLHIPMIRDVEIDIKYDGASGTERNPRSGHKRRRNQ